MHYVIKNTEHYSYVYQDFINFVNTAGYEANIDYEVGTAAAAPLIVALSMFSL